MPNGLETRLNSWKEIASHLGRDVATVRRWERDRGMPVHRVPGGRGASVYAYVEEIDAWLTRQRRGPDEPRDEPSAAAAESVPALRIGRRLIVAVSAVAVLLAAALIVRESALLGGRRIARLTLVAREIRGLDSAGATRWSYPVVGLDVQASGRNWYVVDEPDASGEQLIVASVDIIREGGASVGALLAFDGHGRLLWRRTPDDRLRFGAGEFGPPWSVGGGEVAAFNVGGERRFAWAVHHATWWPSILVTLDTAGRARGRFVNSGWLSRLLVSADGRFLLASGVSNSLGGSALAVLDTQGNMSGASPETDGSPYACLDCPAGGASRYLVFARSELSRAMDFRAEPPALIRLDGRLEVRVPENREQVTAETIYEFSARFELLRASRTDSYWAWYRRAKASNIVQAGSEGEHSNALAVRTWDAERGWTEQRAIAPAATVRADTKAVARW